MAKDRDIMNLPTSQLTKGEINKIRIFVMDAIDAGHMTRREGMSRLRRNNISTEGFDKGGAVLKAKDGIAVPSKMPAALRDKKTNAAKLKMLKALRNVSGDGGPKPKPTPPSTNNKTTPKKRPTPKGLRRALPKPKRARSKSRMAMGGSKSRMAMGGSITKAKSYAKSYAKGGSTNKSHNYFAGGSVTNMLKRKSR